jgi:hypothetical protein
MIKKLYNDFIIFRNFIKHNKKHLFIKNSNNNIFLVEFNRWQAVHIVFSYLVNYFSLKKKCKIIAFESYNLLKIEKLKFLEKIKWKLGIIFNLKTFGIYKSFGTSNFLEIKYSKFIIDKSLKFLKHFYKKNITLKNLENLCVENIWIGDLIYDSYLKKFSLCTVNLNSEKFRFFFLECLNNFYYWLDYFNKNNVSGVAVSHAVYVSAIPLRIADHKKILNFSFCEMSIVNCTNKISYRYKKSNSDINSRYFKKIFKQYKKSEMKDHLKTGKEYIEKIVSGKIKYHYLKKNTFSKKNFSLNYLNKTKKIKVVIYAQMFTDSPHAYGNHFFSDFIEWLNFLKEIIKKTDYHWFIKTHPNEDEITKMAIRDFLKNLPNVKLLPKNISNLYLSKKIDFALTIFGTVASELPIFGVKVINASRNNPHFDYKFCINPKNIFDYKKILLNLKKNKFKINLNELYEYHFMMKNYRMIENSYIFSDIKDYTRIDRDSGREVRWTNLCYNVWLSKFSEEKHFKIKTMFERFIESDSYMIMPSHK